MISKTSLLATESRHLEDNALRYVITRHSFGSVTQPLDDRVLDVAELVENVT